MFSDRIRVDYFGPRPHTIRISVLFNYSNQMSCISRTSNVPNPIHPKPKVIPISFYSLKDNVDV